MMKQVSNTININGLMTADAPVPILSYVAAIQIKRDYYLSGVYACFYALNVALNVKKIDLQVLSLNFNGSRIVNFPQVDLSLNTGTLENNLLLCMSSDGYIERSFNDEILLEGGVADIDIEFQAHSLAGWVIDDTIQGNIIFNFKERYP